MIWKCERCGSSEDVSIRRFPDGRELYTCYVCGCTVERRFLRVREYARKIGVTPARVRVLLQQRRIPGAYKDSVGWKVPEDAVPTPATKGPAGRWEVVKRT